MAHIIGSYRATMNENVICFDLPKIHWETLNIALKEVAGVRDNINLHAPAGCGYYWMGVENKFGGQLIDNLGTIDLENRCTDFILISLEAFDHFGTNKDYIKAIREKLPIGS